VDDEKVVVDLNHPLAGQTLTFDIEVVGISATATQDPAECGSGCACSS
jgi:peptidylprolyl isomerase